ncbi:hypothetical protein ACJIZ3_002867 [Penstemon smallii]|uniref:Cystatin domain-containing protein n=1 Tax=Penstemon smallii TaxID=265156 RepID=A0ABD3U7M2_9LAMI
MATKSHVVIFALVLSILATATIGGIVGGSQPIENPNDPTVVEIAKFAVAEHNKNAKAELEFVKVVKGEILAVVGTHYKLVISAKDGSDTKNYEAVVYERPWDKVLKLIFFKNF